MDVYKVSRGCPVTLLKLPKPLEAAQLLPISYCVYTVSLKRIINRTPRLEVLLESLEALEALEPKTYNVF